MTYAVPTAAGPVDAIVRPPGSKSYTNRALLLAALAGGESLLSGALFSDDTRYMCESLGRLGVPVVDDKTERTLQLKGHGGRFAVPEAELFIGNAGTAARFLTAALTAGRGRYLLDGSERMRQRPIEPLLRALRELGADVRSRDETGCPPVVVSAAGLPGGHASVDGSISSQYLSALLMVAPLATSRTTITIDGDLVSEPYIDMTVQIMRDFGATVTSGHGVYTVPAGQTYQGREYAIEADASSASYFFAAAAVTGGCVRVEGVGSESRQGDLGLLDVLEQMGCSITRARDWIEVRGPKQLRGVTADFSRMGDVATTLLAIAPFADSPVTVHGVAQTHYEESDRPVAAATELRRMGLTIHDDWDSVTVQPGMPRPTNVRTYDDHRIAMSFAITGLAAPGIAIEDPDCTAKTYPHFTRDLSDLVGM